MAPWRAKYLPLTAVNIKGLGSKATPFKRRALLGLSTGPVSLFRLFLAAVEEAETSGKIGLVFSVILKISRLLFQAVPLISSSGQSIITTSGTM